MKYRLVTCEQQLDYGKPVACLFSRGEDGQRYMIKKANMPVYCYTSEEPNPPDPNLKSKILHVTPGFKSIFGKDLFKVEVTEPKYINQLKKFYKTHEGDIQWTNRVLIDLGIKDGFEYDRKTHEFKPCEVDNIPLRTWVVDIEISDAPTLPTWRQPYYPIICIIVYDSFSKTYYEFSMKTDNEIDMLEKFAKLMQEQDPDIITGWNVDFDVSYLIARMENLRKYMSQMLSPMKKTFVMEARNMMKADYFNMKIGGRIIFDSLKAFKVYKNPSGKLSSYNLKTVAKSELNMEYDDLGKHVTKIWKEDPDKIIKYCKKDVEATWGIIENNKLIDLYLTICSISGVRLDKAVSKEAITDSYLLRIAKGRTILPSRNTERNSSEKASADSQTELKGGMVLEPDTGLQQGIACFDAAGLYPSIMIGFNVSPECKDPNGSIHVKDDRGNTYSYRSREIKSGIVPQICIDFRDIRKKSKQKKVEAAKQFGEQSVEYVHAHQFDVAIKTVMNGVYGVVGNPAFRLFDLDCANTITAVGRNIINGLAKTLGEASYPTVYGDTDSVFVKVSSLENVPKAKSVIESYLGKNLKQWGVDKDTIDVAFEKYFERLLFKRREIRKNKWVPVKKKYVGHMTYSDNHPCDVLFIRGFETRRSDTSPILNKLMMDFFTYVIKDDDKQKGFDLLRKTRDEFTTYNPIDIGVPRAIHKQVETSPWYRGMKYAEANCDFIFDDQTSPRLLWIERVIGDHPKTDAFCIQEGMEVPKWIVIDWALMFDKVVKKKFRPILHELGTTWDKEMMGLQDLDQWL